MKLKKKVLSMNKNLSREIRNQRTRKEILGLPWWLSGVRLLATSWTAAYQAPPSMGFSRQEYWSGVPLPSPIARLL